MTQEAYELLGDSLAASTRSDRRFVFLFSTLCLLISYTGIVPTEPKILGFEFPNLTENMMYWVLFGITLFTYICFLSRLCSDISRYRYLKDKLNLKLAFELDDKIYTHPEEADYKEVQNEDFERDTGYQPYKLSVKTVKYLAGFRLILDCWVPVIYGLLGLVAFSWYRLIKAPTL